MKRICLFLIAFTLLLAGCNSNKVKVRGKVIGLQGTVKLLAEMPGQQGLVILAQQDVTDGNIDLETEALQIPARVWVDVAGKNTLEFILDSKDQIWIQGKIKFPDQIEVKGSGLDMEYAKLKKMFKEKYEGPIEPIDKAIKKIMEKPKRPTVDPVLLLTREDWETFVDKSSPLAKEKYLFCYLIDKKPIKQNMAIAEQIAKERGLKIKYIWMHLEKESFRGNFINDASPVEFLNYMYHASAVMTDGYHGTVFSTIFNKPMYSVINNRQSTDSRIRDYLTLIGLESRIFYGDAPVIPKEEIDYTEVDPKIRSAADASKAFLQSAIDNERVVR